MGTTQSLSVDDVLAIHEDTLALEGSGAGLRDSGLIESAVMMPRQQFGGRYLHEGLAAQAAAYLFHIAANHAFLDGNKRTGAMAALIFLELNGVTTLPPPQELQIVTLSVATGNMSKDELIKWMQEQAR